MTESEIISLFYQGTASSRLDDCSELKAPRSDKSSSHNVHKIVTMDCLSEGTHFRLDWSGPEDLAVKLISVNASDIYSSGGVPSWCMLGLGIPSNISDDFIKRFADTLISELGSIELIGGDTFKSESLQLQMTMGGNAHRILKRSDGKIGDTLFVTGKLGLSIMGYMHLSDGISISDELKSSAIEKHLRPRVPGYAKLFSDQTFNARIHACMDLSDGVIQDSARLAAASQVSLIVHLDKIPGITGLSPEQIAQSGEELEFLFLANANDLPDDFSRIPATAIGEAKKGSGVDFRIGDKPVSVAPGFVHFLAKG